MTKKGYFFIAQLYKYLNKFQEANIFSRKLSQLNGVAHHVVVDVNIFLGDCNAQVPSQAGQHTHTNPLGGQVGDEAATHGVTGCAMPARLNKL